MSLLEDLPDCSLLMKDGFLLPSWVPFDFQNKVSGEPALDKKMLAPLLGRHNRLDEVSSSEVAKTFSWKWIVILIAK